MSGPTGAWRLRPVAHPRPVDSDELVGVSELAEILGVSRSTISQWDIRRGTTMFPLPLARLKMGALYDRGEVVLWHQDWRVGR